jgi:hypothetical protein
MQKLCWGPQGSFSKVCKQYLGQALKAKQAASGNIKQSQPDRVWLE